MIKKTTLILALLFLAINTFGWEPPEADYSLIYKITPQAELKIHIFDRWDHTPEDKSICVVFFNGGGWKKGWRKQFAVQANFLSRLEMVGICAEYRNESIHGTDVYTCVEDARGAIRFIRSNADILGIDPDKIIAAGGSAGGHLAIMTALGEEAYRPNGLMIFNGVLNTGPEGFGGDIIGPTWKELSPYHNLKEGMPDTIIFHGAEDHTVPLQNAIDFQEKSIGLGNNCILYIYNGQRHGFFNFNSDKFPIGFNPYYFKIEREMVVFLRRYEKQEQP